MLRKGLKAQECDATAADDGFADRYKKTNLRHGYSTSYMQGTGNGAIGLRHKS